MKRMNMVEEQKSKLFFLRIFPKCPFYKPVPVLIILVLIALGTLCVKLEGVAFWSTI